MPTTIGEPLYTAEVADYLKLDKVTIYRFIREGKLGAIRLGSRRYRITKAHIEAFLTDTTTTTVSNL
jgi:excisionase family DNA binding protein